jgi:hypothetical protein
MAMRHLASLRLDLAATSVAMSGTVEVGGGAQHVRLR